ncbi:MAG TPA: cytochrome c [Thiobacillaceae bacterium]|nr:cytochrome c [Thiobacillaceae bacterium]HNL22838.1 cytochrome c [Rhodocyclaceae bacterium]HNA81586.1 cytochrome c [Thiobacillaceae bacterium]HNF89602.1 cytochrome c [Thiobacillaceae bacterium]HNH89917.1 cytochrome c [Thiobacillaceae bacterium]
MKSRSLILPGLLLALATLPFAAQAGEGDWKRGRIYYRMVCTACHTQKGGSIAPSKYTKAEWAAYIKSDKHAKGKDSLKYYWSKSYRDSIKASNKAAEKFADLTDQELMDDLKSFVEYGAKDGEKPASCS